jgi:hypothetical protein
MKNAPILLAAGLALASAAAFAEGEANTPFDPRWAQQEQQREAWINQRRAESLNPQYARELGDVPPGYAYREPMQGYTPGVECWNTHANHYEDLRPGPWQGDLDHSRCRYKEGYAPHRWR